MLSTPAFNALLKTLEEPPPQSLFIFATTNPEKIPFTVLSRCQRHDLRRIPSGEIAARLRDIAKSEGVTISERGVQEMRAKETARCATPSPFSTSSSRCRARPSKTNRSPTHWT